MLTSRRAMLLFALTLLSGCQDADQLSRLGAKLSQKAEAFFSTHGGQLAQSWPALSIHLGEVALDARVSARLRWDNKLSDLSFRVTVDGGNVELQGKVQDGEQRKRAVELAESTVGVEKVTDKLEGPE